MSILTAAMMAVALPQGSHCDILSRPPAVLTTLASFIAVGLLVSYLPQHLKIIRRGSSEGLSPWFVGLGALSSICAIANILVLPSSREDMACCKSISGGACFAALLGVVQIGMQWSCFMFIVFLYLIYSSTAPEVELDSSVQSLTKGPVGNRQDAIIVSGVTMLAVFLVGFTSIALVAAWPHRTQGWANTLGIASSLMAVIQYFPQIAYTFKLKEMKSFSAHTLWMQVPGSFVFALSLFMRVGWEGWSTWTVLLVTGTLQCVLLGMAIRYKDNDSDQAMIESDSETEERVVNNVDGTVSPGNARARISLDDTEEPTERTSLLHGSGRKG